MVVSVFLFNFAKKLVDMRKMIREYSYRLLKVLSESKEPLGMEEMIERAERHDDDNEYIILKSHFESLCKTMRQAHYVRGAGYKGMLITLDIDDKTKKRGYVITDDGLKAMEKYEKLLNYDGRKMRTIKGHKFVIVENKSASFVTGMGTVSYCHIFGLSQDISDAKLFNDRKEAENMISEFWKESPTKYQNKEQYDYSVEEVNLSAQLNLPATFMCRECGKIYPIKNIFTSTPVPRSWEAGMCQNCASKSRQERYEKERGVYAYESYD